MRPGSPIAGISSNLIGVLLASRTLGSPATGTASAWRSEAASPSPALGVTKTARVTVPLNSARV